VGGRMTGGSHNGSLRWAGERVLYDVENRAKNELAQQKLSATNLKTQTTAFNSAVTDFRKIEELYNDQYRNNINQAIAQKDWEGLQNLIADAWSPREDGKGYKGISPIALVADVTKPKESIRTNTGGKELRAWPDNEDPNKFWFMDGDKMVEANIGPGGGYSKVTTDTLENLKKAAGEWYSNLKDKNKNTLKTAFNNGGVEMDQSVYQSKMSAFADKYGKSREYIGEILGDAVLTAAASGLIPKGMTLTGFLEWTMYHDGQVPQISKLAFKNSTADGKESLIQEQISKLRNDIPNINEVISATDAELVSAKDGSGKDKEVIIIPSAANPKKGIKKTFNEIEKFIKSRPAYTQLSKEQKTKIDSAMTNLNPYIALLYLNQVRMNTWKEENK